MKQENEIIDEIFERVKEPIYKNTNCGDCPQYIFYPEINKNTKNNLHEVFDDMFKSFFNLTMVKQ